MTTWYFGCDGNGTGAIRKYADNPNFRHIPVTHFSDFDEACAELTTSTNADDTVIVDTIDMLALTHRGDLNFGTDTGTLWKHREKFFGEKRGYGMVNAPTETILRHLRNISRNGEGAKIIVTAHEAEKTDKSFSDGLRRLGPDLTPQFRSLLVACSSDIIRLGVFRDDDISESGKVLSKKGERVAFLEDTEEYIVKITHPEGEGVKLKTKLRKPTYPGLCAYLGRAPSWLTVYSPAGIGKTTFAASSLDTIKES